ncbi:eamA-like transporter family protein [Paraburkholderia xenovorans LB400]|uniref:10 TMS drug/metabolite exporter, DME family, DMT super family n=1 Tax=Paraburkholderia xenovorans (strain LB400) TaxID=266265 RepID=Q13P60_PARXL|nr:DMT family transporter [Paraburkholderia xenovorans]ABE34129.1 Putative 10 TMS drug/metabolite exporter, DME family, DMT super family [Paraburkholderia xenovorans LB400]AIP37096.1 eamA-like transporter family protein [Paraburkholderia xenovorans LB400]
MSLTQRQQGAITLASGGLLMGTLGIFVEEAQLGALVLVFFRCLFGFLSLAAYCAWKGFFTHAHFTRRTVSLALITGVLMVTQWVGFFDAIHRTSIAVATVVFHVQPFWVVLIGAALFNERLGMDRLGWIAAAFVGLVLASGVAVTQNWQGHASYLIGVGEALVGSVLYASVTLIAKGLGNLRPHLLTLTQCAVGVVCLPFIAPLTAAHIGPMQWFWLVGMGVLHTGLSYVLIYGALPKLSTPVIAVLLFVYPLTAIVVDAVVYGRALSIPQFAGMVLIVVASLGVNLGWPLLSMLRPGWRARRQMD